VSERRLNNWLDGYLEYTDNTEPPEIYRLWVGISVVASVLQRRCFLQWDSKVYPNMYIILVGPSGKCRKGTAMRSGLGFLREQDVTLAADATTREALIKALKNAKYNDQDADGRIRVHSSLTIFSQELTVFLGYRNNELMSALTAWYDCDDEWIYRTKHQGVDHIVNVWVNLIGATTPELIQASMPQEAVGGGLTSRMIFVYAARKGKNVPYPKMTEREAELRQLLSIDLKTISMIGGEFAVSDEYLDKYETWYSELEKNPPFDDPRFNGYMERRSVHLRKLGLILNACRTDSRVLDIEDFDRALEILEYTERSMRHAFGGVGRSDISDLMYSIPTYIANEGQVLMSRLLRRFALDAEESDVIKVIAALEHMKEIEWYYTDDKRDKIIKFIGMEE